MGEQQVPVALELVALGVREEVVSRAEIHASARLLALAERVPGSTVEGTTDVRSNPLRERGFVDVAIGDGQHDGFCVVDTLGV
jgi:hypothetical protein